MSFVVSGEGGGYQSTPLLILTVCIRNPKFSSAASTSLTVTGPQRPTQSSPTPARYAPSSRKAPHPASSPINQSSCAPPDPHLIGFSCQPVWSLFNQTHHILCGDQEAPHIACLPLPLLVHSAPKCKPRVVLRGREHPPLPGCECKRLINCCPSHLSIVCSAISFYLGWRVPPSPMMGIGNDQNTVTPMGNEL